MDIESQPAVAGDGIKPGVSEAEPQDQEQLGTVEPAERTDRGRDYKNGLIPLSAASRASYDFGDGPWGSATLHPRLYAIGRFAG